MANGAGAADVTATMQSLAIHLGLRAAEIDVTFTSLSMSFQSAARRTAGRADPPGEAARHRLRGPHPRRPPGARRARRPGDPGRGAGRGRADRLVGPPDPPLGGHGRDRRDVRRGGADARRRRAGDRRRGPRRRRDRPAPAGDVAPTAADLLPADRRRWRRDAAGRGGGGAERRGRPVAGGHRQHHHAAVRHRLHGRAAGRAVRVLPDRLGPDHRGDPRDGGPDRRGLGRPHRRRDRRRRDRPRRCPAGWSRSTP